MSKVKKPRWNASIMAHMVRSTKDDVRKLCGVPLDVNQLAEKMKWLERLPDLGMEVTFTIASIDIKEGGTK